MYWGQAVPRAAASWQPTLDGPTDTTVTIPLCNLMCSDALLMQADHNASDGCSFRFLTIRIQHEHKASAGRADLVAHLIDFGVARVLPNKKEGGFATDAASDTAAVPFDVILSFIPV